MRHLAPLHAGLGDGEFLLPYVVAHNESVDSPFDRRCVDFRRKRQLGKERYRRAILQLFERLTRQEVELRRRDAQIVAIQTHSERLGREAQCERRAEARH